MESMRKPGDRFLPFYAGKNLPDPSKATVDIMDVQSFGVDREPFFRSGECKTMNRYRPTILRFKRMRDEEGNWAWTFPLDLSKQQTARN